MRTRSNSFLPLLLLCLLITALTVLAKPLSAQRSQFRHRYDLRPFNFGMMLGTNINTFDMSANSTLFQGAGNGYDLTLTPRPGIEIGLITNLNLHNNIDLRVIPHFSLANRNVNFRYGSPEIEDEIKTVEFAEMKIPFLMKFKSDYYKRVRVYTVAGAQYGINFQSNKKVRNDATLIKTTKGDLSWVLGVGVDLYGERIKLTPEIRYSRGFFDIYSPENTVNANAISSLRSQTISFVLNFE